ncbi:MAG: hypothetical protein JWN87_1644 [Frankiales bacterium]|jgi:uncharacterized GH25 family protein|nr:hypothetical protein [Frankiales bacterium]
MCGAPDQATLPSLEVSPNEAVIHGTVVKDGQPLPGAYVRLLGTTGEFTAEVQTSATGYFRFYAADGDWTLRTLAPGQSVDTTVTAAKGSAAEVTVEL